MPFAKSSVPSVLLVVALLWAAPAFGWQKEGSAKEFLEDKGIRVLGSSLSLADEAEFVRKMGSRGDGARLKRDLDNAAKKLADLEKQAALIREQMNKLRQELVQFAGRLTVARNNQIVAALEVLTTQLEQREKQVREARGEHTKAQEAYIDYLLEARKLADKLKGDYARLGADPEVIDAVERLNKETGRSYELTESRSFLIGERNLKRLEDAVLSETIDLRTDGSSTFYVSTVINEKHSKELVVDSGASLVTLPYKMAVDVGVAPTEDDENITLQLADGSLVQAKRVTIPVMRVGKFELNDVDCAVMPAHLPEAAPLLGMSFLRNFSFKIDSDTGKLTMTSVDSPESDTGSDRSRTRRPSRR
jgi:clan AA aspartic protease (TIGR02281 family)